MSDSLPDSLVEGVRGYTAEHCAELARLLADWVRIPSISADPEHAADVEASAQWFVTALRAAGFPTVEIWPTAGHPAVFAEWLSGDPDATTVLVYGHHDVQPVDPVELWTAPPFEPLIVGEGDHVELRGRGAIDDKGQLVFHLIGLRAHLAAMGRTSPAVNLKFLVEGEEESNSPHFAQLLTDRRDRLDCDVIVVSDTTMFDADTPSICTSMRGMLACHVDVFGPSQDLHSGVFGGAIPNPLHALTGLLAALHDADGAVAVPGFYDDVIPLTEAERKNFASLPFDEADWLAGTARSQATFGEAGFGTLE
ncbi:MAG: M20/M25/M40 family metallo-hydrolase, partial [Mycobacteriales bacterium]